jgi:hypothetical protein
MNLWFENIKGINSPIKNCSDHVSIIERESEIIWHLKSLETHYSLKQIDKDKISKNDRNFFPVEFWNLDSLDTIFDTLSESTKRLLTEKKLTLLVYFPFEGFSLDTCNWLDKLEYSLKVNRLENCNKILIFGNLEIEQLVYERNNFWNKVFGIDFWQWFYAEEYKERLDKNLEKDSKKTKSKKEKDFLSLNGATREHRLIFCSELERKNLNKFGHVSMVGRNLNPTDFDDADQILQPYKKKNTYFKAYCKNWKPLVLDKQLFQLEKDDRGINKSLYKDSFFSVVTETCVSEGLFLTEKTFKPIVNLHPFMILGQPGILKYLKSQGYKTFPELFDESYDNETDLVKRIDKIQDNIEMFSQLEYNTKLELLQSVQDKLKHNKKIFLDEENQNTKKIKKVFKKL